MQCKDVHRESAEVIIGKLQLILAKVPRDDYGLSVERWRAFRASIDSVFPTTEKMQEFLWKFSQTAEHLKGVALINPSQAAMQALREGRPLPDQTKSLNEIQSAVLSFLIRLPNSSLPPTVLLRNYRALLLLTSEATPQELKYLKAVFAAKPPETASDPVWSAQLIQALDAIQKRLGHRILQ